MQFSIRSLLILIAVAAVFTQPAYEYSVALYEQWKPSKSATNQLPVLPATTNTVVVPDAGVVIIGGNIYDHSEWILGKMVPPQNSKLYGLNFPNTSATGIVPR